MANRITLNETSYFGKGSISSIVGEVKKRGFRKALLITDKDLVKFGVTQKVTDILDGANLKYKVFDEIKPNPTVEGVQNCLSAYRNADADYIIAVGGGSSIDTGKAVGIIVANPQHMGVKSLEGADVAKNKAIPMIAIPTTAGTAAEVTINYVITDEQLHRKFVCADVQSIPIMSIVDPDMMSSMPRGLTAATGMDALTHAIEGYITKGAWELTDMLELKAIEIISRSLRKAVDNEPDGRADMAIGQYIAGMGFSNVGLGIVHSMAHPLGAVYNTAHGIANAVILSTVMEFNACVTGEKYRDIARAMGVKGTENMTEREYRMAAVDAVKQLAQDVGIPSSLSDIGVKESDIEFLAKSAMADACTPGNPRDVTVEDIISLYRSLM